MAVEFRVLFLIDLRTDGPVMQRQEMSEQLHARQARIDEDASSQSNGVCLTFLYDNIRLFSVGITPGKVSHTDVPFAASTIGT